MNSTIRSIGHKLYITAQVLILIVGSGISFWNFVAGVHDIYISYEGKACAEKVVGTIFYKEGRDIPWNLELGHYLKKSSRRDFQVSQLRSDCSKYFRTWDFSEIDDSFSVQMKNYIGVESATFSERLSYLGLSFGISLLLMATFFGLHKWISWLIKV